MPPLSRVPEIVIPSADASHVRHSPEFVANTVPFGLRVSGAVAPSALVYQFSRDALLVYPIRYPEATIGFHLATILHNWLRR